MKIGDSLLAPEGMGAHGSEPGLAASPAPTHRRSLSARLMLFVMAVILCTEIAVFLPSVERYRTAYLEEAMGEAHVAALSLAATPARMITPELQDRLLDVIDAEAVTMIQPGGERLELARQQSLPRPERILLDEESWFASLGHALAVLIWRSPQMVEVVGSSPREDGVTLQVLLPEALLEQQLRGFALRIAGYALLVSGLTAGLLYMALRVAVLRDILRLADSMRRFQQSPDAEAALHSPARRPDDELFQLERRFIEMQQAVRLSLQQQGRLAALGGAVARINHDLRNMLATASMMSERMMVSEDPQVRKLAPRLLDSLDRAVNLCQHTLSWSRDARLPIHLGAVSVAAIVRPVLEELETLPQAKDDGRGPLLLSAELPDDLCAQADGAALGRAIGNLARNAIEAGARHLHVGAALVGGQLRIDLRDDGPGLPPRAREHLFLPFAGSSKPGGTGLGLAIAREIVQAHGGEIRLMASTASGTWFRLELPAS